MKAVSGKHLAKLARKNKWHLARIHGSHHIFTKEDRIERIVIPIHGNRPLKIGLQKAIMKMIPVEEGDL